MAIIVQDSFTRADSTTTLGTSDTGQVWQYSTGAIFGVSSNQAYWVSGGTNDKYAFIDVSASDCSVSFTLLTVGGGYASRLFFRMTDANNYWFLDYSGTAIRLMKRVAGGYTQVGSYAIASQPSFAIKVTLNGTSIVVNLNSTDIITATDAFNQTSTKHGVGSNATAGRFDDFLVESLATGGTAYTASLSDSITSSETFSKALSKVASDTLTSSEIFVKLLSKTINDSTSATDSIGKSASKTQSDAIITSDTLSKRLTVTIVDTVTSSESTGKADSKAFNDTISSADSITSNKGKALNLSDSIAIVDTISKAVSRLQTDSINTMETKGKILSKAIFDTLTLSDTFIKSSGKYIMLSDNITISDNIGKSTLLTKLETLGLTDSSSRRMSINSYDVIISTELFQKTLPNAPTIIGTIKLSGDMTLYVYLSGTRELNINLKGGL